MQRILEIINSSTNLQKEIDNIKGEIDRININKKEEEARIEQTKFAKTVVEEYISVFYQFRNQLKRLGTLYNLRKVVDYEEQIEKLREAIPKIESGRFKLEPYKNGDVTIYDDTGKIIIDFPSSSSSSFPEYNQVRYKVYERLPNNAYLKKIKEIRKKLELK
jgi:hypothetical protein